MNARGFQLLALCLGAVLFYACGEDGVDVSTSHELAAPPVPSAPTQLLQMMVDAPEEVPYQAVRRYEAHWKVGGVDEVLVYREDAISNGLGGFSIDPLEVLEPAMSTGEADLFLLLQKQREGFFFRYRDFRITDYALFLQRWQVTEVGQTTVVGRTCTLLDVQAQTNPTRVYHLAVDSQNGLVLRSEERDLHGQLLSLLEYESLSLMPSFAGKSFHSKVANETIIESSAEMMTELSFIPVHPKLLPPGYKLLEIAALVELSQGTEWARSSYTNGVEEIFFLHQGRTAEQEVGPGAGTIGSGGKGGKGGQGGGAQSAGQGPEQTVSYLYAGPWTILFGEIDGEAFLAIGKVSREELRDLIESAFF